MILTTKHYHVGTNVPGFLPEGDVYATPDWDNAQMVFRGEIKDLQEDWLDRHQEQHETAGQLENCVRGGGERCDWYELWVWAEADRVGMDDAAPGDITISFRTPEGPDIAVWIQECSETGCESTWEED